MLGVQVPPGLPFFFIEGFYNMDKVKEAVQKITQFVKEARVELKKVTWPTPKQTMASTAVVIILVFILSVILGIFDFVLAKAVKLILG